MQITKGLGSTTFTVIAEENNGISTVHEMAFKLSREKDKDTLTTLTPDADHSWRQIEGWRSMSDVKYQC